MSDKKILNVGIIGYGFMGRTHANAYRRLENFFPDIGYKCVLKAVSGLPGEQLDRYADMWGFEEKEPDWRKLLERDDIDIVDICTPNNLHKEMAIAAAKAGKMIICEKPLALNVAEGAEMVEAVEKAGVANLVSYNYRRVPAVTLAKNLVDEGRLGKIFHYRANFLQDWTIADDLPQGGDALWRLDVKAAGSGVTGDLLAHCIDTAMWLNGKITSVTAMTETFVKQRMHTQTGKVEEVGIDDACAFLARFENGSLAIFESTRYARGHKALYTFEINGEHASIKWDLHDLHRLEYFEYDQPTGKEGEFKKTDSHVRGWRSIHVTDGDMPYMDKWWVPGLQIGYEHSFVHQLADFLDGVATGKPAGPTFREAQETQKVCEAVLTSAKTGQWVMID
jgi:predicted dehydrogenase